MVAVPMPPPLVPSHLRAVTRGRSPTRRMVHLRERQCLAPRPCGAIPAEPVPQALQLAMMGPYDAIPDEPVPRALPTATLDSAHRYFQDTVYPGLRNPPGLEPVRPEGFPDLIQFIRSGNKVQNEFFEPPP